MITIIKVRPRLGYNSGYDHLIDGSECDEVIGQEFRRWADVARAVNVAWRKNCCELPHARLAAPPITVTARVGRYGDLVEKDV